MNCFDTCIQQLGLNTDSQGFHGHVYLLLKMLSDFETAHPTGDTYANKYREVLHRLGTYERTHAY